MTLFSRVTEICRERLPSIRVARITIDSIFDLDRMLQPGIRFGVTVRNTIELVGTPIASMGNFYFSVDVMDGDERWIIQKMENWRNGTYQAFYRIFYDEECVTRLDGVDGEELGWRNAYDVFQLNSLWEKKAGVYNLDYERPLPSGFYTLQTAVAAIPVSVKKQGLIIVFQSNHRVSDTYQFYGLLSEFDNLERWEKLIDDYDLQDARDYYNLTRNRPITNQEGDPLYYTMDYDPEQTELFAPAAVPSVLRKKGFILTFSPRYEEWESWQFVSSKMSDFEDAGYWVRKDVTKQLIESLLTGEIKSHRHPSSNYVLDSSSSEYGYYLMEQGAAMQASKSVPVENRFINLTIFFQTLTAWESWQFIGTDITTQWNNVDYWLKIPVGPSLALGEELGTAYEGSKGKANADAIASISSDLSTAVSKLEGIQDNAEVNQFAFSNIIVGSSTIASTTKTDTFELVEGSNITLSSSGKKITISSSNVDAGYVQVGSARIVYVPEDSDTGTPGYIKIQHADGSTAMHLVTTGGQTMCSTGVPAEGGSGGATVILNGVTTDNATFWAPTSAGTQGQYLIFNNGLPAWADFPTTFAPSAHYHDDRYYTETEIANFFAGSTAISGYNKSNWDTAYSKKVNSVEITTSTLTLTRQDESTITATIPVWNQDTSGNAATATALKNARSLWGNSFDGSSDIYGDILLKNSSDTSKTRTLSVDSSSCLLVDGHTRVQGGLVLYSTFPAPLDLYDGLVLDETTITRDSSGRLHVISSGSSFDESAMWAALALTSPDTIHLSHLPSIPLSKIVNFPQALSYFTDDVGYALVSSLSSHTGDATIHITSTERSNWDTAYGWGNHALAGYAAQAGSASQNFTTKTLDVVGALNVAGLASFASGVGVQGAAITIYGKDGQELPYLDFRHGVSGSALSRIISLSSGELSIFGKQVNGAVQPDGKIKLKNDTYAEKALYIGGASGAKLVYVAASGDTPAYLKLQNHDGGVMHFVTTGGQTMHSEGVPAAIEELQTEVMVIFNTSEEKADIIIGDRVKNRFMVIVPEATNGMIYINMIFNNVVPFGFLAEYEVYLYIESIHITNTVLSVTSTVEPLETYTAGMTLGTLESTDMVGKGLHKLTYIRDRAAADTHMGLYVKHEYFEKL